MLFISLVQLTAYCKDMKVRDYEGFRHLGPKIKRLSEVFGFTIRSCGKKKS